MTSQTSPDKVYARRKAWAIGLVFLGFLAPVLGLVIVPWVLANNHYGSALATTEDRLERYRRIGASRPLLEEKLRAVRDLGAGRFFLQQAAASKASAELQDTVRRAVLGGGGKLVSVQVGPPRDEGRVRQVSVTIQLNASIGNFGRILAALDASEPYLFVDSMTVRGQTPPGFRPTPGAEPELFAQIDVSAFAVME